ncbi:uncharacterized protein LACBIDRAFT_313996 [Laccaria bicolor S238N-H82]|uniref:Predicted protein n=1 Tax=Laccaria bicolor (strain S238N-H82 / ATCC MYA-4686) TaxID=486041 RepID=B0D1C2_LACBS|nr:uncharacterized protein LACBIDRAFT_313996 [Laccaria bicolor S238N-H82]EDR11608.1 predicted protein [Laccaria bicolor S238N-H82]|eukprot:XP_001877505.1 predicted protein [Laccaria bicolor S238N-H82]
MADSFPSLIGGFSLPHDLVPSIVFAATYGLLIPISIWRIVSKRSRSFLIFGTTAFVVERTVMFSLRAVISRQPPEKAAEGLVEYLQTTIAMGFVALSQDLAGMMRAVLVNGTYGSDMLNAQTEKVQEKEHLEHGGTLTSSSKSMFSSNYNFSVNSNFSAFDMEIPDHPRTRFWIRRIHDMTQILFVAAMATGFMGNSRIVSQRHDPTQTTINQALRYTSTAVTVFELFVISGMCIWAYYRMGRVNKRACSVLAALTIFLAIPAIYRLSIMSFTTSSYYSLDPGSNNSTLDKAIFYLLNVVPEWAFVMIICSINVREVLGISCKGDERCRDETKEERVRRETKEQEKKLKNGDATLVSMPTMCKMDSGKIAAPLIFVDK